jgi:signal peptidase I
MSDIDVQPERFAETLFVRFQMEEGQFFVLGDNSPRSLDGRLWRPDETYVRRELLIGKALFVYWPHALDHIPGTEIPFPFFPNFARMRMIR